MGAATKINYSHIFNSIQICKYLICYIYEVCNEITRLIIPEHIKFNFPKGHSFSFALKDGKKQQVFHVKLSIMRAYLMPIMSQSYNYKNRMRKVDIQELCLLECDAM